MRRWRPDDDGYSALGDTYIASQMWEVITQSAIQWAFATLTIICLSGGAAVAGAAVCVAAFIVLVVQMCLHFRVVKLCFFWLRGTKRSSVCIEDLVFISRFVEELHAEFEKKAAEARMHNGSALLQALEMQTWQWVCGLRLIEDVAMARGLVRGRLDETLLCEQRIRALDKVWTNRGGLRERVPGEPEATLQYIMSDLGAENSLRKSAAMLMGRFTIEKCNRVSQVQRTNATGSADPARLAALGTGSEGGDGRVVEGCL